VRSSLLYELIVFQLGIKLEYSAKSFPITFNMSSEIRNINDLVPFERLRVLMPQHCNSQLQSPLFNKLPGEIRNIIFDLVLSLQDGESYPRNTFYYRPDHHCNEFIDHALLRTCRRIYLETYNIPLRNVDTLRFWFTWEGRAPPQGALFMLVFLLSVCSSN
jgi:hypothetical protein